MLKREIVYFMMRRPDGSMHPRCIGDFIARREETHFSYRPKRREEAGELFNS